MPKVEDMNCSTLTSEDPFQGEMSKPSQRHVNCNKIEMHNVEVSYIIGKHHFDYKTYLLKLTTKFNYIDQDHKPQEYNLPT